MDKRDEINKYKKMAYDLAKKFTDTCEDHPNEKITQTLDRISNGICQALIMKPLGEFAFQPIALWEMDATQIKDAIFTILEEPDIEDTEEDIFYLAYFVEYELISFQAVEASQIVQYAALMGLHPRWVWIHDEVLKRGDAHS
ncbi:MAG TPA: hypothetical protein PK079_23975 [Leptospiraceae bacterium]|nr:hypothetical protein [Leptospiraceae bacterium]HMZ66497.1 hypothetical protein [Leptospiraceae bacterium]HNA10039.1 hypothetical protein [Leptospiraceae bacterium]HNC00436.1 hypothetical protein [Leptospiraceae bacterium]HNC59374.1 hypothetical protein [Leptospiraceae bacterium]